MVKFEVRINEMRTDMKSKILSELARMVNAIFSQVAEVITARRQRKGENPIYREIEAERIHSNYIRIIPATVVLLIVEICGMLWAIWTNVKFDYGKGFLCSCIIFTFVSVCVIIAIEIDLRKSFISNKKKKSVYIAYWIIYMVEALSFSVMEYLDRGAINNYITFIIVFTLLPVIEPIPKLCVFAVSMAVEVYLILYTTGSIKTVIVCIALAFAGVLFSQIRFFYYMSNALANKKLEFSANGDPLTGFMNRRGFEHRVNAMRGFCDANGYDVCFIMMDIDNFKRFNDVYGHVKGDICIKAVADCIKEHFSRPTDLCVRYGGEEFLVVTAQRNVPALVEHLTKLLKNINQMKIDDVKDSVSVSVGVYSVLNSKKKSTQYFIEKADEQLYKAKNSDKNCVAYKNEIYR